MNMERMTEKSREALEGAVRCAKEYGNQSVEQVHLLYALLTQDGGLIPRLLEKEGTAPTAVADAAQKEIEKLPKVSGGQVYGSDRFSQAMDQAETITKRMGDSYVSVEHLLLALVDKADLVLKEIFKRFNERLRVFLY